MTAEAGLQACSLCMEKLSRTKKEKGDQEWFVCSASCITYTLWSNTVILIFQHAIILSVKESIARVTLVSLVNGIWS